MASEPTDQSFWDLADKFIDVANAHNKDLAKSRISAAFLYAAARYNAFFTVTGCTSVEEANETREVSLKYFLEQFEKAYLDNFDDIVAVTKFS